MNCKNPKRGNQTPLHVAALKGHLAVVDVLLNNGAAINALNDNNRGGRRYAVTVNRIKCCLSSVIQMAVISGEEEVVRFLMKKGANFNAVENGRTSADLACVLNKPSTNLMFAP